MKKILLLVSFLGLSACYPQKGIDEISYRETPVPIDTGLCGSAEYHLTELCKADRNVNIYCCRIIEPTKNGKQFTEFCIETQNAGVALNPKCLSTVKKCEEVDVCVGTVGYEVK